MIKICFVCLGNICRSPMAEFIMKEKLRNLSLTNDFLIKSKATSYEERGNDLYSPAKKKLAERKIPFTRHYATRLEKSDYEKYDYFICMDSSNITNTLRIFGHDPENKIFRLLDFTTNKKDIADPWYTNDFETTYCELSDGIDALINFLMKK